MKMRKTITSPWGEGHIWMKSAWELENSNASLHRRLIKGLQRNNCFVEQLHIQKSSAVLQSQLCNSPFLKLLRCISAKGRMKLEESLWCIQKYCPNICAYTRSVSIDGQLLKRRSICCTISSEKILHAIK